MLVLLQPLWLAASAALVVPIALHLLSRGPGPRVLVGSIRLLEHSASRRARRIALNRPWLLLLRCLLLLSVIVALAQPVWQPTAKAGDLVLVDPEVFARRSELEKASAEVYRDLDRLVTDGTDAFLLAPGLPEVGTPASIGDEAGLWSLVTEAARERSSEATIHVFVLDRLAKLSGIRPRLANEVRLSAIPEPGTRSWVERESLDAQGPLLVGSSSAKVSSLLEVPRSETGELLRAQPAPILRAAIRHDPDREVDASYVAAAMRAAAEILGRRLDLDIASSETGLGQATELLFLLSSERLQNPSPSLRTLIEDRGSEPALTTYASFDSREEFWQQPAHLFRRGPPGRSGPAASIWTDSQGRSVLEEWQEGELRRIVFHGRFHPHWTDLVERPAFPRWVAELSSDGETRGADLRQAGESQWLPSVSTGAPEPPLPDSTPSWIWLPVALLFLGERFASGRIDAT